MSLFDRFRREPSPEKMHDFRPIHTTPPPMGGVPIKEGVDFTEPFDIGGRKAVFALSADPRARPKLLRVGDRIKATDSTGGSFELPITDFFLTYEGKWQALLSASGLSSVPGPATIDVEFVIDEV